MPFEPRTKDEIAGGFSARLVAQSRLTDISEGGEVAGIAGAVAEEVELVEGRMKSIRDSFDFANASGQDLDERVRDFPGDGMERASASAATGNALIITRTIPAIDVGLTVPAGSVYSRSDDPSIQYVQTGDAVFAIGQTSYPDISLGEEYVPVSSTVTGTRANCGIKAIDTIISAPDGLVTVTNPAAMTNATDRETDDELIVRGFQYLSSLARTMPAALEFLAKSFRPSDGSRIRFAKVFEDPAYPAYSELVIDAPVSARKGATITGTVPTAGQSILYHEHPAVDALTNVEFLVNGAAAPLDALGNEQWVSVFERGQLFPSDAMVAAGQFVAGDTWSISGYNVYTGTIAELQGIIEGDLTDPLAVSGYRAAGSRVRVVPPTVQPANVSVNIVIEVGVDAAVAKQAVLDEGVAYSQELAPGQPLLRAALTKRIMLLDGITNVTFNATMASGAVAETGDVYAASPRNSVRLTSTTFEVT